MISNKKNGLIFISNVQKALEHEWFCDFVDKNEFNLEFALFNSKHSELYNYIVKSGFKCKNYSLPSKYFIPIYILFFYFKFIFKNYHFVHCHLFEASLIGLISAKWARVKKRIYTRHHSDFHHVYYPKAVKYDLLINRMSTHIVAVSYSIQSILIEKENVELDKVTTVPHGIPLSILNIDIPNVEIFNIKKKYHIENNYPIIGVISRFTEWKGIQYIIPAFNKLLLNYPNAKLILANARGDYEVQIKSLLNALPINSYQLISFDPNISILFKTFDVFVHTPIDSQCEAFGQVYIESLAFKIPMICTLSGIANEFIINKKNALVVNYKNSDDIFNSLTTIFTDTELRGNIIKNGFEDVKNYSFEAKFKKLKQLYLS